MTAQAVSNDQPLARQMAHQMAKEFDHLRTFDGAGKAPKVKVPPRHPCHCRQSFPVEVVLQHRGLSPRRPGAAAMGPFAEPALVDENYDSALIFGLFLTPASAPSSSAGGPSHRAPAPGPPVAGNSSRAAAGSSRHAPDDNSPRMPARSDGLPGSPSTGWFHTPAPAASAFTHPH